jgi:uncharacterized protein (TIGR02594 family)
MTGQFSFLNSVGTLPKMIQEAIRHLGVTEIPGQKSHPEILRWAKETGMHHIYVNDDIAWCGLFVAYVVKMTGRTPIHTPLWARNWARWGVKSEKPMLGDILVFERGSGGHVGFYIAEDSTTYYVLGGNQGNTVNITRINKSRLLAARRPVYNHQPNSVKSYVVNSGGLISTNEA